MAGHVGDGSRRVGRRRTRTIYARPMPEDSDSAVDQAAEGVDTVDRTKVQKRTLRTLMGGIIPG